MKIYIAQDTRGNIHISDKIENMPGNLNLVRFYEHDFPGKRHFIINLVSHNLSLETEEGYFSWEGYE